MLLSLKLWLEKRNRAVILCLAVIVAGVLLDLLSIQVFPGFQNTDESWIINYTDTLNRTGHIGSTLVLGTSSARAGLLQQYLAVVWENLLNQDLFAQRDLETLVGLLLLPVIFGIGAVLQDWRAGLYATVLLAVNVIWLSVSHIGPPDMLITFSIWSSFLLFLIVRRTQSRWLGFIAGVLAALTMTIHPAGGVFCLAIGIWWLLDWRTVKRERVLVVVYAAGGILGAVIYFILEVLPSIPDFIKSLGATADAGIATPWAILLDQQTSFFIANPVQAIMIWYGLLWAFSKRGQARRVALFTIILALLLSTFINYRNMYYEICYMPGLVLAIALALRQISWQRNYSRLLLVGALTIVTAAMNINTVIGFSNDNWNHRVLTDMNRVASEVPLQGRIVANPIFYLVFRDPRFLAYTPYLQRFDLMRIAPDFIISVKDPDHFGPKSYAMTNSIFMAIYEPNLDSAYQIYKTIDTSTGEYIIWQRKAN